MVEDFSRDLPGDSEVYVFIGHNRGVAVDFEGNKKRNGWYKTNIVLAPDEQIKKLAFRGTDKDGHAFGSNSIVPLKAEMNRYVAEMMTFCDAMISDPAQKEAWKKLLRDGFWKWHDEISERYNLDLNKYDTNIVEQ
jgi:hypothetical protein